MDLRTELFKTTEILPFCSQYIFSLLLCVVNNKHLFTKDLEVHNHETRSANNFRLPNTNWIKYQKGAHYAGFKIFNLLPTYIKCVGNKIQVLNSALKKFLLSNSFYSIEEYFNSNKYIYSRLLNFKVIIYILLCNHCVIIVFFHFTAVIKQILCVISLWLFPHP
jgi:hypothetical protein